MPSLDEDVNVDELRRRARRRLVGAIVLALAAAVIVPMLLESEPKPLGEDVAVKIPPVDDGKFVNRLNDPAARPDKTAPSRVPDAGEPRPAPETAKDGKDARPAEAAKAADAARAKYDTHLADKDAVAAETRTSPPAAGAAPAAPTPPADTSGAAPTPAAPPSTPAAPPSTAAATASQSPVAPAKSAPAAPATPPLPPAVASIRPTPAAAAPAKQGSGPAASSAPTPAAASATTGGGFAVQLAAFSDDKGANALAGRLKRAGYAAYTEPYKTSKGTLWRVRVGPYASRETANAARDKLKAEGQNGIVAPAH